MQPLAMDGNLIVISIALHATFPPHLRPNHLAYLLLDEAGHASVHGTLVRVLL